MAYSVGPKTKKKKQDADYKAAVRRSISSQIARDLSPPAEATHLFVSFDLGNSTAFKNVFDYWPIVYHKFYELACREMQAEGRGFEVWKLIGDEILLYKPIRSANDLAGDIKHSYRAVENTEKLLSNIFEKARNFLSVKATAWLAKTTVLPPQDIDATLRNFAQGQADKNSMASRNIVVQAVTSGDKYSIDFLGKEVDVGFRIAKYAHKGTVVVGANLARYLSLHATGANFDSTNLRIVHFASLRGVWGGRPYPIVWYRENWDTVDQAFYYDEHLGNDELSSIVRSIKAKIPDKNIGHLEKVFSDLNIDNEIADINHSIKRYKSTKIDSTESGTVEQTKMAEVHCVAVCFRSDGRFLMGRRPKHKRTLPNVWEFGCTQLRVNQSFQECISIGYLEDFSAKIADISDVPVATYLIKGPRQVPGMIFSATVKNPEEVEKKFSQGKHSEVRWFRVDEITDETQKNFVPDAAKNVAAALAYRAARSRGENVKRESRAVAKRKIGDGSRRKVRKSPTRSKKR